MRIGIAAARLGEVDGVSFETLKWQGVLEQMGHQVVRCAGALGRVRGPEDALIPEMHLMYPPAVEVTAAAFDPLSRADVVRATTDRLAGELQARIEAWLDAARVDVLIVQNAWAIPMHLPLGLALARVVEKTEVPAIGHHHDYWWERERFARCVVPELLDVAFPPALPSVKHVSINSLAAAQLRLRRGLDSTVVPNVFDFEQPVPPTSASEARRLRYELGFLDRGLLFVQPTRVVPRKGIELAVEMVARLNHPNSVLLITSPAGDEGHGYLESILDLAAHLNVEVLYQPNRFYAGDTARPDSVAHSLADAYIAADVITYPSLYEGFGNALIEAIFFRKLVIVNRYSVYDADIRPLGFRFIELNGEVTDDAVDQLREALRNRPRTRADTNHNFELGVQHFGYARLRRELEALL